MPSSTRERILAAASTLFYRYGFQAVGVDRIVAESGVAKMTLYRHFSSKDELIVAHLERADAEFWKWFDAAAAPGADAKLKLFAVFSKLEAAAGRPRCPGRTFQSAAAEFPDADHPVNRAARRHKKAVGKRLAELAARAGVYDSDAAADQLLLLMNGAWAVARIFEGEAPARSAASAARLMIEGHLYAQSLRLVGEDASRMKSVR